MRERDPLVERQRLGSALWCDPCRREDRGRARTIESGFVTERGTELLATVPERVGHEPQERLLREIRGSANDCVKTER